VALVYGWKGDRVLSVGDDGAALRRGAGAAYAAHRLRASILKPTGFIAERNSGDNGPACLDLRAVPGNEYRLCFAAKGGGSANRTSLSMETPALLDEALLSSRLEGLVRGLGASACPPYRIAAVLGGESPDEALYALALAGLGLLDALPLEGEAASEGPGFLRSPAWEERLMGFAKRSGIGAQFGGSSLALSARALRLPRHAASLPLAFGVSCSALRRARAVIGGEGVFLERLEEDPARFLPAKEPLLEGARRVDLDRPMGELLSELGGLAAGTPLLLSGTVVTARDAVHARLRRLIASGSPLPPYVLEHPLFYAGPTEAAPGQASGSFGPTTASRMDPYLPELLERGASLVSIAKGGRSPAALAALKAAGGVYLGAIGGAAALAAREHVVSSRLVDYPELGMEAVRLVVLRDLPVLVLADSRGGDFYSERLK
jgi:fumarate hydratase class I